MDVFVGVPGSVADDRVKDQSSGLIQTASVGASFGAAAGTIIPGVGNVIGGAVGFIGGALGSITGIFGGGSKGPIIIDLFRGFVRTAFSQAIPGGLSERGGIPELTAQYDRATIQNALNEIRASVLASVPAGSQASNTISNAFTRVQFSEGGTGGNVSFLIYQEAQATEVLQNGLQPSNGAGIGIGLALSAILAFVGK